MATAELVRSKEIILSNVTMVKVGERQTRLLPQLATIYYQTWQAEGLCGSLTEAAEKMAAFDPENAYIIIDEAKEIVYALIQTLPIHLPSLAYLPHVFPTYRSVEEACLAHSKAINPNFLICFSINVLPGYRIGLTQEKTQSLSRFLLKNLPVPSGANRVAYSRFNAIEGDPLEFYLKHLNDTRAWGAVGIHEIEGVTAFIIKNARPEDIRGGGCNIPVVYPKTPEEAAQFTRIKAMRRLRRPLTRHQGNIITFTDAMLR